MKRNKLNIAVNFMSFLSLLPAAFSGIVMWLILPAGRGMQVNRGLAEDNFFWSLHRRNWMELHEISSLVFIGLMLLHLILHWRWIKNMPKMTKE